MFDLMAWHLWLIWCLILWLDTCSWFDVSFDVWFDGLIIVVDLMFALLFDLMADSYSWFDTWFNIWFDDLTLVVDLMFDLMTWHF